MMKRWLLLVAAVWLLSPVQAWADDPKPEEIDSVLKKLPAGTTHQHVMMPLRDGVKLATDVFIPQGGGPWPVVLLRTPYSRFDGRGGSELGVPCVLVCQNQRGRYGSEGTLPPDTFENEVNDSYDAVEWCAKQPWCNGKVAMWGPSGHGVSPANAAWSKAPHLVAVSINISADCAYLHWGFNNGARREFYSWLRQRNQTIGDWPRPTIVPFDMKAREKFLAEHAANNKVCFLSRGGWFDLFSEGALDAFAALAPNGRAFVVIGPDAHGPIAGELKYPNRNWPAEAQVPTLKQLMTGAEPRQPKSILLYFLMGDTRDPAAPGNIWKTSSVWPVPSAPTDYYLHKDGSLALQPPKEKGASLSYVYDPRDPAPSIGGNYGISQKDRPLNGPYDQRPLLDPQTVVRRQGLDMKGQPIELSGYARKDVLRFVSVPLAEPAGITGKVWVELHFSSDAPDTMFVAKLVDVYPDGYEALMRESAGLARYWKGDLVHGAPLERGKVYAIKMDLWSTALVFNRGHRIGLYVTSSSKDAYEVHPNSFEPLKSLEQARTAHNTIHLSAEQASRVILPVIPRESYVK